MNNRAYYHRRTKIVCTIGPASGPAAQAQRLIRAGMDVARLNLSHGTFEEHSRYIDTIRKLSRRLGTTVAILIDLPGPKYRIGRLKGGQVVLKKGARVKLTTANIEGGQDLLPVSLPNLAKDIRAGNDVILDDGDLHLKVIGVEREEVRCRVVVGGLLRQGRGLVVPGMRISVPFLTDQLRKSIQFAIKERPDYIALSFVTGESDIAAVKTILRENKVDIPVISKIERVEAITNFNSILAASDGIMIARGDLGVEMPLEKVPLLQKELIKKCNRAGKPVITATEMLESMINQARPTRAETTDVANAIFDGTDAVMLSAETSIGRYPVAAVKMMVSIARATERRLPYDEILAERRSWLERETDELISYSACQTAHRLRASAIMAFTQSGSTAVRVSKYRASVPILALTPVEVVSGKLQLYWGVRPYIIGEPANVDELFAMGAKVACEIGLAGPGDLVVITAGIPLMVAGTTNMLKVERISS
ncbi:MAG: pyruvate kinase [Chloroflexi bacterium RBG_16_56_11]|nr:MAG: pyruvate kinase [Chloroflexi bacterium RBG_16_56_11]